MKPTIKTHGESRCSYRCPYYMDGPVLSLCRLNNEKLAYDATFKPLRTDKCKSLVKKNKEQP